MSTTAFAKLCDEFRQAAGMPELEVLNLPEGAASFFVSIDGVEVQAALLPQEPAVVQLIAGIGAAGEYDPSVSRKLAETNAWLIAEQDGPVICRVPVTREYAMSMALPLDAEVCAARLTSCLQSLAAATARIRSELATSAVADSAQAAQADVAYGWE